MNDIQKPCTKREAQQLTDRIRQNVDQLWSLLMEANDRRAWKALGYPTMEAYIHEEIGISRARYYQIINQGRVIEAIQEAAGVSTSVDISEAAARDIKPELPAVTAEIKTRVESGEAPQKAAADVIAEQRAAKAAAKAERAAQQAEWGRQQEEARRNLNPAIQRQEAAKHANGARNAAVPGARKDQAQKPEAPKLSPAEIDAIIAERDELREENAALKDDVARLTAQITKFDEMVAQYERGGFEAVIATKDQRIQGLLREVEDVTADRASLARSRDHWRKTAIALGYVSPNSRVIEVAPDDAPASAERDLAEEVGF